jgi:hypothetical protein
VDDGMATVDHCKFFILVCNFQTDEWSEKICLKRIISFVYFLPKGMVVNMMIDNKLH